MNKEDNSRETLLSEINADVRNLNEIVSELGTIRLQADVFKTLSSTLYYKTHYLAENKKLLD